MPNYVGRFAPSPTGALHLGSLYTALASYLEAKSRQGSWRIRIDDIDTSRNIPRTDLDILTTLEIFGLAWDDRVIYQSQNIEHYAAALKYLLAEDWVYACTCSRKQLLELEHQGQSVYPQTCLNKKPISPESASLRLKTKADSISFIDCLQGKQEINIAHAMGDFIIRRRDQIFAYQFAVVLDDRLQGITDVVRGADLLSSTFKQLYLHKLLNINPPRYCHLPLVVGPKQEKLSKRDFAPKVNRHNASLVLFYLLQMLKQSPPTDLAANSPSEILLWALANWDLSRLRGIQSIALPENTILRQITRI